MQVTEFTAAIQCYQFHNGFSSGENETNSLAGYTQVYKIGSERFRCNRQILI